MQRTMRLPIAIASIALLASPAISPARLHLGGLIEPSEGKQCIDKSEIRAETAEAQNIVIFHAGGGSAYRNTMAEPCENLRGINNLSKIKLPSNNGDQICAGDKIRVVDHDIVGEIGSGEDRPDVTSCTLGTFEPISEMSLEESLRR